MTVASAAPTPARKSILLPAIFAGIFCAASLAILVFVPASVHYAKNEYFSVNGPKVASISVNIFVADYQQRTRTLDLTEDMARKGFTTVNTVEWSIESRRLAAVLVVPAIWIIVRIVRRASTNA